MREVEVARAVEPVHEGLVGGVASLVAEADQVERHWRGQFEAVILAHPAREFLRQRDMLPDVVLHALAAIVAQNKPQLQRAEAAAKRNMPVAVVDDGARFGSLIA